MSKKTTGAQKLYRNAGASELVFEGQVMEPGAEFRVTLTPEHEQQLLTGGHIEILEDQSKTADAAQADAAETATDAPAVATEETGRKRRNQS